MSTEIERKETVNNNQYQPNPMDVLQGIAILQCVTLGFLVSSQIMLGRSLRRMPVKEVVVVYREAKEGVVA